MKKIINILLAVILVVASCFTLIACDETGAGSKNKGLLLKKYDGEDFYTVYGYVDEGKGVTSLDIGEVAGEKTVGRISENAFLGNDTLVEIIVPNTVEEISKGAFAKMKNLEKITLPFVGANKNADAYLFETDESEGKAVDFTRTFGHVFGTEEYPYGSLIEAGYGASSSSFYIPAYLEEVTIAPAGEYKIPMYAFSGVKLINKINLTGNVTAIGQSAFEGCRDLQQINIPSTVKTIYKKAFKDCEFLSQLTFDQNSELLEIKDNAFDGAKLEQIVLPENVMVIGKYAFARSGIKTITLSKNLTSVMPYAFFDCKYLTSVNVSLITGAPSLGASAFEDCISLDWTTSLENVWGYKGNNYNNNVAK